MRRGRKNNLSLKEFFHIAIRLILGVLFMGANSILVFFLAGRIYHLFRWVPPVWLNYPLLFFLTLLLIFLEGQIIYRLHKHDREDPFMQLLEAFGKISRGDYDIQVELSHRRGHFSNLIRGLYDMAGALKKTEEMRQRFISDMSHEIQSPLTSIRGFARILREEELAPEKREAYLEIIEEESLRLSKLAEELLEMTKLESPDLELSPTEFSLGRQLRDVILHYEPQWLEKGLDVSAEFDEVTIRADRDLLIRVWNNLFHNAIKFTPPGKKIRLSLGWERERKGFISVVIADEGIGMERDELSRIFERFHKADKSRTRMDRDSGSGLGLSIVRKIVTLHGGDVRAESPGLNGGSVITVTLPVS